MQNFKNISDKLNAFIRRYYINELLKGVVLFFTIGLLYFLLTLFIEHVLWLQTPSRSFLFWLFVGVESALLIKFVCYPLTKLCKLQKGLSLEEASKIIGNHFPEVNDKLLNVIQLSQSQNQSELLIASIEQKALGLHPIPFKRAVNFKKLRYYLKFTGLPLSILLFSFFTGNSSWFGDSYERVINFRTTYQPPPPFSFVLNDTLNAIQNKDFKLLVRTSGKITPQKMQISFGNETYFLQQKAVGEFEYVFYKPRQVTRFQLSANGVFSKRYTLNVIETPRLSDFQMVLKYPKHTNKKNEVLKNTGNTSVPEGTHVTWRLQTKSTEQVHLFSKDTLRFLSTQKGLFEVSKRLFTSTHYTISTSNQHLSNYEKLEFSINVIKDQYPEIKVTAEQDTIDSQTLYFRGLLDDDYGLSKLQLVYYPSGKLQDKQIQVLPISSTQRASFTATFPGSLRVAPGVSYLLYFEVFDNDAINLRKSGKSPVFTYRKSTKEEEKVLQLSRQNQTIQDLNRSLETFREQERSLEELTNTQKEKATLLFNDKKKLETFFRRQKAQDELMQQLNKKLKKHLDDFSKESNKETPFEEDLKRRLQDNENKMKRDETLLNEIEQLLEKMSYEQLKPKLEALSKQTKNKKRSLEQLLELTKRFYVEKKLEKLNEDLMKLSVQQDQLSQQPSELNTKTKQNLLNQKLIAHIKSLDQLEKDSQALQKPIDIPRDLFDEKEAVEEQQKASKKLETNEDPPSSGANKNKQKEAQQHQKKAAQRIKKMSQKMQQQLQSFNGEQLQEDVVMLRQVLDNLLLFSFDQEALMMTLKKAPSNQSDYAGVLKKQYQLREHFTHVDDSLFALSMRNPKLSERVNKDIADVYYRLDQALDYVSQTQIFQGISSQQFTMTAANNLSNYLSNTLDNMQEELNLSPSQGKQGELQLPDIILSQEELNRMMEEGLKKDQAGKPMKGDTGSNGKEGKGVQKDTQGASGTKKSQNPNQLSQEALNGMLFQLYQQQHALRKALQDMLGKEQGDTNKAPLVKQMENIELDLLNHGFHAETFKRMKALKYQLLKLDQAAFQQGIDNKRQSQTNDRVFDNSSHTQSPTQKEYLNSIEILNRQALPLHQFYKQKVQSYFEFTHD